MNPHWLEEQGGQRMLDVAILIDKYDLKAPMKLNTNTWFRQPMGCIMEESVYRMAAAWILEEEEFFAQYSWIVMITYPGPYAKLLSKQLLTERLPSPIFRKYFSSEPPLPGKITKVWYHVLIVSGLQSCWQSDRPISEYVFSIQYAVKLVWMEIVMLAILTGGIANATGRSLFSIAFDKLGSVSHNISHVKNPFVRSYRS